MPFSMDWYVPGRVIYMRVWGDIRPQEIFEQNAALAGILKDGIAPVHIIASDREVTSAPRSSAQMRLLVNALRHPALGWVVTAGETHPVAHFMTRVVLKSLRIRYHRADALGDAVAFIWRHDSTVNWQEANAATLRRRM